MNNPIQVSGASKVCSKCKEEKSVCEFGKRNNSKDGLTGQCRVCLNAKHDKHRENNREVVRESSREWARRNKLFAKEYACTHRFQVALYKSKFAAKKDGHKMCDATPEELDAAFTGKCNICGVPEIELNKRLCMDHDHETGKFRGWLCVKCNKGLGLLGDSEELLVNALHYVMAGD